MAEPLKHDHFRLHYIASRAAELEKRYFPSVSRLGAESIARSEFDHVIGLVEVHGRKLRHGGPQ